MDDKTKEAFNSFAQQIITAASNGAAWTLEQAPSLVQEWLRWYATERVFFIALFLIIFLLPAWLIYRYILSVKRSGDYIDEEFIMFPLALTAAGFLGTLYQVYFLIKVLIAPRLVVMEELIDLIK